MAVSISEKERATFARLADALIPSAEGMPSATMVKVHEQVLERLLSLRPDLRESFSRGCRTVCDKKTQDAIEWLNENDPIAFSAIGLLVASGYFMNPGVRQLIGYPGQESRPADAYSVPEYMENGMLQMVIDRGSIYRDA